MHLRDLMTEVHRLLPALSGWAHGRLPGHAREQVDTDDLVQEAALGAIERERVLEFESPRQLFTYLQLSVRRRIIDEIRHADRREKLKSAMVAFWSRPEPSPLDLSSSSSARRAYFRALKTLDADDQLLLRGRLDLRLSYEELAFASGRGSPDAARMAVRRALLRLAKRIEDPSPRRK